MCKRERRVGAHASVCKKENTLVLNAIIQDSFLKVLDTKAVLHSAGSI